MKRTPLKRRGYLKRGKKALESKSYLRRSKPIRARSGKDGRFPHRRVRAYREWIATLPCILAGRPGHRCKGDVVCCHVKTRNTGGDDVGNCYPGCTLGAHEEEHRGQKSFEKRWGINLAEYARQLGERYAEEMAA